jgi:hypothetical protein
MFTTSNRELNVPNWEKEKLLEVSSPRGEEKVP